MAILSASTRRLTNCNLKRLSSVWFVICALIFFSAFESPAQTAVSKEYQLKSVFLFNFAQFVEWPTNAFPEAQTPLTIGVLGNDPFGAYLAETVRREKVNRHPFIIHRS